MGARDQLNTPNFSVPLAASYNPRGIAGWTNTVTNALDQRKINSMYEPVENSMTGKITFQLTKRPGTSNNGSSFGTSGQTGYLVTQGAGLFGSGAENVWLFSTSGDDSRASSDSTTTTILSAAGYYPAFAQKTSISGTDTIVVQLNNPTTKDQRTFFSSAIGTFTEISVAGFTGIAHEGMMAFVDGWAFVGEKTTSKIYNSDLNSLANWSGSFITKQIRQDEFYGLAKLGKQVIAFGAQSAEVFVNAGTEAFSPLISIPSLASDVGVQRKFTTGLTHYYAEVGGRIYFVGRRGLSSAGLFTFDGAKFERISSGPFEKIINENFHANTIYSVNSVMWGGKEAIALQLTATTATTQRWLMFFPAWKAWFEWVSTRFTPVNNGRHYLGVGSNQHKVLAMKDQEEASGWEDDGGGATYQFLHQFQLPQEGPDRKFMPWCGVTGDTARSALNLSVEFSDDDGVTWSSARTIDMTGPKKNIYRCGSWTGRRFVRLSYTGALEVRLKDFVGVIR